MPLVVTNLFVMFDYVESIATNVFVSPSVAVAVVMAAVCGPFGLFSCMTLWRLTFSTRSGFPSNYIPPLPLEEGVEGNAATMFTGR